MSPRLRRSAITSCAALAIVACTSHNGTGPQGPPGSQAFAPSHDTSLAGTIQFKSVTIPAGVTVTATGPLTLEVSGATQIAGTLAAPCYPLSLLDSGTVTVSGTVNNACNGQTPATSPDLRIFGQGGLDFNNATFKSAGAQLYTNDTTLTDVSFATAAAPSSASHVDQTTSTGSCNVSGTSFVADQGANGADGSPVGKPGQDGDPWALQCTGTLNVSAVSVTGQNGGNGGKGTSTSATTAQGGQGGKGGTLRVRAAGDIVFAGQNTLAGGNGGNGGAAIGAPTAPSANANAIGGAGGDGSSGSGNNGPVSVQAKGNITITGPLAIIVGHGGAGGAATATATKGADGNPGQPGGAANATGGKGGNTLPYTLSGTNASGLASVMVTGGNAGVGGNAIAKGGNGGNGTQAAAPGGKGGDMKGTGGAGGNAQVKDQNGALIGTGGNAGTLEIDLGNGGNGFSDCVANMPTAAGGNGGAGGNASGTFGTAGTGRAAGAPGTTAVNTAGNGGTGGNGVGPGQGGPPGSNTAAGPAGGNGPSFARGANGATCPAVGPRTFTVTNGDATNQPWLLVAVSINGAPFIQITPSGLTWLMDLNATTDGTEVALAIVRATSTGTTIDVIDRPASFFLQNAATVYTTGIGGQATGSVTATATATTGQTEKIATGLSSAIATPPSTAVTLSRALLGNFSVRSWINSSSGLPLSWSFDVANVTNGEDISSLLQPQHSYASVTANSSLGSQRYFVGYSEIGSALDDECDDGASEPFGPKAGYVFFEPGSGPSGYNLPVAALGDLPTGALQNVNIRLAPTQSSFSRTRLFFRMPTALNLTQAPSYAMPTITSVAGPIQAFNIQGQIQSPYQYADFTYRTTSGGKNFTLRMHLGYELSALNATTPTDAMFNQYGPPTSTPGIGTFKGYSADPYVIPTDGAQVFEAGFSFYRGSYAAPSYTLAVTPNPVNVPQGGTAPVQLQITRTNFTGQVYVGSFSAGGVSVAGTVIPAGQTTGSAVIAAGPSAAAGQHTVSIAADAVAGGVELPFTDNIAANVTAAAPQLAITLTPSPDTIRLGTGAQFQNFRIGVHVTRTNFTGPVNVDLAGFPANAAGGASLSYMSPTSFTIPDGQSDSAFVLYAGANALPATLVSPVTAIAAPNGTTLEATASSTVTLLPWPGATFNVAVTSKFAADSVLDKLFQMEQVKQITLSPHPDSIGYGIYVVSSPQSPPWATLSGGIGFSDSLSFGFNGSILTTFQGQPVSYELSGNTNRGVMSFVLGIVYPYPGNGSGITYLVNGTQSSAGARVSARPRAR